MATFRSTVRKLTEHLTSDDVGSMKLLCQGAIPMGRLERVQDALTLFQTLEEHGKLSANNLYFINSLLDGIGKVHLMRVLTEEGQSVPSSHGPPGHGEPLDYRAILNHIATRLTEQDIKQMLYLFQGLNAPHLQEKLGKDAQEFLLHLERRQIIALGSLDRLRWGLGEVGRVDLAQFTDECDIFHRQSFKTSIFLGHQSTTPQRNVPVARGSPQTGMVSGQSSSFGANLEMVPSTHVEMEYRKMLASVATNLTNHNFTEMMYVSADYFKGVQPRTSKPLEFFSLLEQRGLLSPTNLGTLQALLSEVERNDLIDKLKMFVAITHQPPGLTSARLTNPLQESYVRPAATAPPMHAAQDPVGNPPAFFPPSGVHHLHQPEYPMQPIKLASGIRDTPYGVAQTQPPSSNPVCPPEQEHRSIGPGDLGFPEDESPGLMVRLPKYDTPPGRLPSVNMDCHEHGVSQTTSSSKDTTPRYPHRESAGNDPVDQSAFRSTAPASAAYLQMERQATGSPQTGMVSGQSSSFGANLEMVPSTHVEMEYRKMLASVATNLTNHNFTEMMYVSADYFKGVQPHTSKPLEFFSLLEQRGLLSPTNLGTLQALLSEVERNDLIDKLKMFVAITHQPPGLTSARVTNPLQESYVRPAATAPPMHAAQDPVGNPPAFFPPSGMHHLHQPEYPMQPIKLASGIRDTPYGVAQTQPPSSDPVCPPEQEHRSIGPHDLGFPEDETPGLMVRLPNYDTPPERLPSVNTDCHEHGVSQTTSSSKDTTPRYPHRESAGNDPVDQSAFRSTAPASEAYLQMERQAPHDPRIQEYCLKDIQEEMLMEERERETRKAQEDAQRRKKELEYQNKIRRLEQEKEQLMMQVQQEQLRSRRQKVAVPAELCYPMNAKPHGLCIIFNNDKFYATSSQAELPDRKGSDVDQHNLGVIFSRLNYRVQPYKNLTAEQMLETMKAVSNLDHSSSDSLVCCLLTHGKQEGVFGADGNLLPVADLASLVKALYCSTLKGKPKMFFVQACRGDDEDKGVQLQSDDDGEQSVVRRSLPNDADFLFAYSTAPGTVSWRSPQYGSWYISKLCETLDQHATTGMDLVSMLTIVNDKVSEAYTKQGFKQCPAPVNMLRKKVIF